MPLARRGLIAAAALAPLRVHANRPPRCGSAC